MGDEDPGFFGEVVARHDIEHYRDRLVTVVTIERAEDDVLRLAFYDFDSPDPEVAFNVELDDAALAWLHSATARPEGPPT